MDHHNYVWYHMK